MTCASYSCGLYSHASIREGFVVFGLKKKGLAESLTKTRRGFFAQMVRLFGAADISEEMWEELEELLIQADVGVETTVGLVERLRERVDREHVLQPAQVRRMLEEELLALLPRDMPRNDLTERLLTVVLIVGVNGSGKTTSIAKLTRYYRSRSKRVILAAADTFRAAAIDQLKIWGERAGVDVIAHRPGAPHETWLVLDATTGQNALTQARQFKEEVGVTGLIIAKLDSTAKGGIVFAIAKELDLPIRFVCTGEGIEDLAEFDAQAFVDGIFD
jgi:fused signal recognition particle receptor